MVRAFQQGETAALGKLYDFYIGPLYRFVRQKTAEQRDAEDIVQATFLEVMRTLPAAKIDKTFKKWLFGIAVNLIKHHWREKYELPVESIEPLLEMGLLGDKAEAVESPEDNELTAARVESLLNKLPAAEAEVIRLRFLRGLTRSEVAQTLAISEETVKTRQYRALKQLRAEAFV